MHCYRSRTQSLDLKTLNIVRKTPSSLNIEYPLYVEQGKNSVFWQDFISDFNTNLALYFLLPGHKYHTVND